ncbi:MAG: hypothetical protein LBR54_04265, partial [Oscillospiraceae bacterium]|nr:hypothetical protein [Oscillospiraceae bacterium]
MKEQNKQLTPEEIAQQDWKGLFYDKLMHTAEKPAVHEPEVKTFKFQGFDAADSIPAMGEVTEPVKKSPGFSDEPDSGVKPKDISPAIHMADTEKENPDTFRNYIGQAYKAFNPPASQEPKKPAVQILGDNGPVPLEEAFPDKVHSDTGNMRSETALETRQYLQELVNGNSPEPSDAVLKHMQSLLKGQLTPQQHAEAPAVSGAPTGCVTAQDKRVISPNTGIDCRVNNTVPTAPTGILRDMPQNFSELPQPEAPAVSVAPTGKVSDMPMNFSELPQPGATAA